jgi:hypothetical protein
VTLERPDMEHELRATLAGAGVVVTTMDELEPSLEDVFIDLASIS